MTGTLSGEGRPARFRIRSRTRWFAAALLVTALSPAVAQPAVAASSATYVQGAAFATATRVTSRTVTMTSAVNAGDLLVGWFGQFDAAGQIKVSDSVNGAWTRSSTATTFKNGRGDIALFSVPSTKAAAQSLKITVTAATATYLKGGLAEYRGLPASSAIAQAALGSNKGTAVSTAATPTATAGQLVFAALMTGGNPQRATPGASAGVPFTARAATATGTVFSEDILSSAAGQQVGSATLGAATDWYAVVAVIAAPPQSDTSPPTVPANLHSTGTTSTSVALAWLPSTDNVGVSGYSVYRDNVLLGNSGLTSYTDAAVTAGTTYTYTVDAYDAAGNRSARSSSVTVTTPSPTSPTPGYVQGAAFSTSAQLASTTTTLGAPVGAGDLLVGWFAQYNVPGSVSVSDSVNGQWTRASAATAYQNDTGDIALYYLANSKAAAAGALTITISAGANAYLSGAVGEYSGVARAGPLDQEVVNRDVGTAVTTGATPPVAGGELVFSAVLTGGSPGSVRPGSSLGQPFTARRATSSGSAFSEDVLAGAAGAQTGTATLGTSTDWYAVVATFLPASTGDAQPPTTPTGVHTTAVSSSTVSLTWTPSTDNVGVTGYTVYRNGTILATTTATNPTYTDTSVVASTTYTYTVDAFDAAANHSAPSAPAQVAVPSSSPRFVQGAADSPGARSTSTTVTLSQPVAAGDLLVGWVAQYDAAGQVHVSDPVNGAWTRSPASESFLNGGGDIALYYVQNSLPSTGAVVVTISADTATYLPSAVSEYSGVATTNALDQTAQSKGVGTSADSGTTGAVPAGELVVGGLLTGGQPLSVTPGQSAGAPMQTNAFNGSRSADTAAVYSSAAGPQEAPFTLGLSMDWYAVVATFRAA